MNRKEGMLDVGLFIGLFITIGIIIGFISFNPSILSSLLAKAFEFNGVVILVLVLVILGMR